VYVAIVVWFAVVAAFFYLLIWRPQLRRMAAVRSLQAELREGDEVMTTSGIYGRIVELGDDVVTLEIAPTTVIKIARGAVGQRVTPGPDGSDDEAQP
jgi:preprotein translocase subunit YajC